jgi:Tfp pilus assembly protein PilO
MSRKPNLKESRATKIGFRSLARLTDKAIKTAILMGSKKTLSYSSLLAGAFGALLYWQFLTPMISAKDQLSEELHGLHKQNAIARLMQETRPQFLGEFRRVIRNYNTARALLPAEVEVSNVMAAIQDLAHRNNVRVTVFDASKPGVKSASVGSTEPSASNQPTESRNQQPTATQQVTLNERRIPAQIVGAHSGIANFIRDVAQYPRIIYVSDITITALNKAEIVNMTLVTYDAPSAGLLPPIPDELQEEFQKAQSARANTK